MRSFALDTAPFKAALVCALGLPLLLAYHNSFGGPFVFDDVPAIVEENPSIRQLWPITLLPPAQDGHTVGGRPLPNYTLALNYALGGFDVTGYHVLNLIIHLLVALLLFGVVRRTLLWPVALRPGGPTLAERFGPAAVPLAFVIALVWALHPLQTESVTYVIQRVESLMALFYLLTLYAFIRSVGSVKPGDWEIVAVSSCLLGMASKEVMVTAPFLVLLYDRTLVSGRFTAALRRRPWMYAGMAATWGFLGYLVVGASGRGGTAGFGAGADLGAHLRTQLYGVGHYLRLAFWPEPLLFDYGVFRVGEWTAVVPQALVLLVLVGLAVMGVVGNRPWGLLGAWLFVILAPSTLVPVPVQTLAEHRMYLPLAAVVAAVVLGLYAWWGARSLAVFIAAAVVLGWFTVRRNEDYATEIALWRDVVAKHPTGSARAHYNYGHLLAEQGDDVRAEEQFRIALRLEPERPDAHDALGNVHYRAGRHEEAIAEWREALRHNPDELDAHFNLGVLFLELGRLDEAEVHCREAVRLQPIAADARTNLGNVYLRQGRRLEAAAEYEEAVRLDPGRTVARTNLAAIYAGQGRVGEAIGQYEAVLQADPGAADVHRRLGDLRLRTDDVVGAIAAYEQAAALKPEDVDVRFNLGSVLSQLGRWDDAVRHLEDAARLNPSDADVQRALAAAHSSRKIQSDAPTRPSGARPR